MNLPRKRSAANRNPSVPNLPIEVTEQILSRTSARSLLRSSLVCKQWRSLYFDPRFLKDYANNASVDEKVIVSNTTAQDHSLRYSIVSESKDSESFDSETFKFKLKSLRSAVIEVSCNGLLLLRVKDPLVPNFYVLYNPVFPGKCNYLPPIKFNNITRLYGFGYDSFSDEHKVVKLGTRDRRRWNIDHDNPNACSLLEVEIYSLKTNSWKSIRGVPFPDVTYRFTTLGTHVLGSINWVVYDYPYAICDENKAYVILSFDLKSEKFKLIDTPRDDDDDNDNVIMPREPHSLVQVRGCLGAYRSGCNANDIVIWIWNEGENKKGCWTKLLTIQKNYFMDIEVVSVKNNNDRSFSACEFFWS